MAQYTYPRNEMLVYQKPSFHQLHHPHPSQWCQKGAYKMSCVQYAYKIYCYMY